MALVSRYKIRYRDAAQQPFQDGSEWCSCEECILTMRNQFSAHPTRDFEVVDDRGSVVASTLAGSNPGRACLSN